MSEKNPSEYVMGYIRININRVGEGKKIEQPEEKERMEVISFVQYMLGLFNSIQELNRILEDFDSYHEVEHQIECYKELLKELYKGGQ